MHGTNERERERERESPLRAVSVALNQNTHRYRRQISERDTVETLIERERPLEIYIIRDTLSSGAGARRARVPGQDAVLVPIPLESVPRE